MPGKWAGITVWNLLPTGFLDSRKTDMPLMSEQETVEYALRTELMTTQIEHFKTQIKWEPWKAMAVAAGAGAGLMAAAIGVVTLLLRATGRVP